MDKKEHCEKMKTRVDKIKSETCLNEEGRLESITFDGLYEAIELLCDEYWTDKNGTKWKVTEMPTRKIKKEIANLKLRFDAVGNRKIQKSDNQNVFLSVMAFCFEWINAFNLELERREKR